MRNKTRNPHKTFDFSVAPILVFLGFRTDVEQSSIRFILLQPPQGPRNNTNVF